MTSKLTEAKRQQFFKEIEALRSSLGDILEFSKDNLVAFNGRETHNYSYHSYKYLLALGLTVKVY